MSDDADAGVVDLLIANKIPTSFWDLPAFEDADILKDVHVMLTERLQLESPDADTLELMMMERVCFLYIFIRASEAKGNVKIDANYHRMMSLWVGMAADLRKTRLRAEETASIRMAVVTEVGRALKTAMKEMDLDPALTSEVTGRLVSLVAV